MRRLDAGQLFAGEYRVAGALGKGSMGMVYEVTREPSGEALALKVLDPSLLDDPRARRRFEREVLAGGEIESEHVVRTLAAGTDERTGLMWLVMELVRGRDLGAFIQARGTPDLATARGILLQIFRAVAAAHARGIVHRDLKPEHVLLADEGTSGAPPRVKVLDFGLAKLTRGATARETLPGLGTPLWTAPEQAHLGVEPRPSADVWALGLIAFYVLTGRQYWRHANGGSTLELAKEVFGGHLDAASVRAADIGCETALPAGFDAWLARCVVREPATRFASAAEALASLERVLDPRVRERAALRAAAMVVVALVAATIGWAAVTLVLGR